ncbi:hypothetical protein U1Q18_046620 [Sarracenia purpurea var. burkii]
MEEGAVEGEVYIAWAMLKYSKFAAAVSRVAYLVMYFGCFCLAYVFPLCWSVKRSRTRSGEDEVFLTLSLHRIEMSCGGKEWGSVQKNGKVLRLRIRRIVFNLSDDLIMQIRSKMRAK